MALPAGPLPPPEPLEHPPSFDNEANPTPGFSYLCLFPSP